VDINIHIHLNQIIVVTVVKN